MQASPSKSGSKSSPSAASRPRTRILEAGFELSAPGLGSCPPSDRVELALAGRSNVGKSSLLNALTRQQGLATVSRQPGRTRLLNFFALRLRHDQTDYPLRLADLPGYGFARAAKQVRDTFGPMIEQYLLGRPSLRALILLMDARRGPTQLDLDMLGFASQENMPSFVCVTKVDKLNASQRGVLAKSFARELGISPRHISLTSAHTGMGLQGDGKRHDLLSMLGQSVKQWSTPPQDGEELTGDQSPAPGSASVASERDAEAADPALASNERDAEAADPALASDERDAEAADPALASNERDAEAADPALASDERDAEAADSARASASDRAGEQEPPR